MTFDAFQVIFWLFHTVWRLFTSFYIPGTNFTVIEWGFFALMVSFVSRYFWRIFTGSDGGDD